ncbi:MAG: flagellar basal body rod protein FlgB [Candidatus Poribacteria bacterium]
MLFDKTTHLLTAGIYYSEIRHKVISNNIANINTPNYKALDITFRDQLKFFAKSLERGNENITPLKPPTTILAPYLSDQRPSIELNTVDIDQEQVKLAQNTLFHNSCLQLLGSKFRIMKASISGNV